MFCWWQKMFSKNLSLGSESFSFVLCNGLKYKCWNSFWASTTRISVSILNTLYSSRITLINFHHVMEFLIQFFSSLRLTFVLFWKTIFNKNYFKLFVYTLEVCFFEIVKGALWLILSHVVIIMTTFFVNQLVSSI